VTGNSRSHFAARGGDDELSRLRSLNDDGCGVKEGSTCELLLLRPHEAESGTCARLSLPLSPKRTKSVRVQPPGTPTLHDDILSQNRAQLLDRKPLSRDLSPDPMSDTEPYN
jgi:hypothetical protein